MWCERFYSVGEGGKLENNRNIGRTTLVVCYLMYAGAAVAALNLFIGLGSMAGINGFAQLFEFAELAAIAALLLCSVGYSRWIFVASKNLWDRGYELEFKPAACIWWNFVPIAALFKPYQAMREIWNTTLDTSNDFGAEDDQVLKIWWGCWIITNILGNISFRMTDAMNTTVIDTISAGLDIAAFWFVAKIIGKIGMAQNKALPNLAEVFV